MQTMMALKMITHFTQTMVSVEHQELIAVYVLME
jgi:hypothetical protein